MLDVQQDRTHCSFVLKRRQQKMHAMDDVSENVEESVENEEDVQAYCDLEEENEQWQEVTSRRSKQRAKKVNQASLLSVDSSQFETEEDCVGEIQVGESQSHLGHQSRRSCDVGDDVPMSNSSAKHHRRNSRQQMESKSETWVRRAFHSRQMREFRGV